MNVKVRKDVLLDWYYAMKNKDFETADRMKQEIDTAEQDVSDFEMKALYKLMAARYHLMYKDLVKFSSVIAELDLNTNNDRYWLTYYYHFFRGIYHYERQEYKLSLDFYNRARLHVFNQDAEEVGEFYYRLAATYLRTYKITLTIEYAKKALGIFKSSHNYKRMSGCEMILGICNQDIFQYNEAEKHYQDALIIAEKTQDELLKARVLHNLGVLYSELNEHKNAIHYLTQGQKLFKNNDLYLITQNLFQLAKNYIKLDHIMEALKMLDKGLRLSKENDYLTYYYRCKLLKTKFFEPQHFETIYKEGIEYYKEHEEWQLVVEYSDELGAYYGGIGKFQEAYEYLLLSIEARTKIERERGLSNETFDS
ncbi:MAG TPA: tetratricopeptide repeat protein [Bacillales bacterium]|nr:tetratricopeptide repeat protein [Bacillales bacterium]